MSQIWGSLGNWVPCVNVVFLWLSHKSWNCHGKLIFAIANQIQNKNDSTSPFLLISYPLLQHQKKLTWQPWFVGSTISNLTGLPFFTALSSVCAHLENIWKLSFFSSYDKWNTDLNLLECLMQTDDGTITFHEKHNSENLNKPNSLLK